MSATTPPLPRREPGAAYPGTTATVGKPKPAPPKEDPK